MWDPSIATILYQENPCVEKKIVHCFLDFQSGWPTNQTRVLKKKNLLYHTKASENKEVMFPANIYLFDWRFCLRIK